MKVSKSLTRLVHALVTVGIITLTVPSYGYRMSHHPGTGGMQIPDIGVTCDDTRGFIHRNERNANFFHNNRHPQNPSSTQDSSWARALRNAMASWTKVPNATHVLSYRGTTTRTFVTDGWNTLSWGSTPFCQDPCLAIHVFTLQSGQIATESDILFRSDQPWQTNGSDFDLEAIAAHELGHALGIFHTEVNVEPFPTVRTPYFGSTGRSLEADDRAALQCSQNRYFASAQCVPDGNVDDTLFETGCCSGFAVNNSTVCDNPDDRFNGTWASCHHVCGTRPVNGCIPSGGTDDTLSSTRCCSGAAVPGSTWCLDPLDYGDDWASCVQTCQ